MNFTPKYCTEDTLTKTEISNGSLYLLTDKNRICIDMENTRHQVTDIIAVASEASKPSTGISNKLYVALAEQTLWIYTNEWKKLGGYDLATASANTLGGVKIDGSNVSLNSLSQLVVTGLTSINNRIIKFWIGTSAEYTTDYEAGDIPSNCACIITDDGNSSGGGSSVIASLISRIEALEAQINGGNASGIIPSGDSDTDTDIDTDTDTDNDIDTDVDTDTDTDTDTN